jgi:glyoxylase-like metal-dependent hydrolase (beta-lactamase superfamily II)
MTAIFFGEARLNRIEEVRIPNKIAYFTQDEALIAANRDWLVPHFLDEHGMFDLVFQSWIVEVGGRVVLIDPCTGNGRPHVVPFFNLLDTPYIETMGSLGYRPQDIDFVVCTHLHHDHCGWNTHLRAGRWVPTFPNARYIVQRTEYERFRSGQTGLEVPEYNTGVFEQSVEPVMRAGLMDLADARHVVCPQVTVKPAPGHTLGHQMVHLESGGRHLLFTGDCFHHPIQLADPHVHFAGGEDIDQLVATRLQLVDLATSLDACLVAAHTPAPYAVRASRFGGSVVFTAGFD